MALEEDASVLAGNGSLTPRLIVITDERFDPRVALPPLLEGARPGTVCVQLRHRESSALVRYRLGETLRRLTADRDQLLSVNDRIDLALALDADGVHLPERGVSVSDVRSVWADRRRGRTPFVTRAFHPGPHRLGPAKTEFEHLRGLDGVVVSPVIEARKGRQALGIEAFAALSGRLRLAETGAYALGGVTAETARACLDAGARGVAVLGAAHDPRCAQDLLQALSIHRDDPRCPGEPKGPAPHGRSF